MQKVKDKNQQRTLSFTHNLNKTFNQAQKSVSFIDLSTGKIKVNETSLDIQESQNIKVTQKGSLTERKLSYTQRKEANTTTNMEKDQFLQTMDQLLTERLSKAEKSSYSLKKDSISNTGQQQKKHVSSLSPFKNVRLSKDGQSIFNQTQSTNALNQSVSILRQGLQRPQNSVDPLKRKQNLEKTLQQKQQLLFQSQSISEAQSISLRSPIVEQNNKQQFNDISTSQINESNEDEKLDIDTYIEDTFISNIQKLLKVKKKLIECTKEYRHYTYTHSPRRQHSRVIESLSLNPLDKMPKRRPRISKDPNIVYLDIDCSDKYGGARDIVEVKVNKSPPLLLNTRIQTHYELQYSNYTGLLNSLTERSNGVSNSQVMLSKLNYQLSTQNALKNLSNGFGRLSRKTSNNKHLTEQINRVQHPLSQGSAQQNLSHQSELTPNFKHQKFIFQEGTNQQPHQNILNGQQQASPKIQMQSQSQMLPNLDIQHQHSINSTVLNNLSTIMSPQPHISDDQLPNSNGASFLQNVNSNQSINNDYQQQFQYDFGFADSHKSYLQTLEEFSQKLSNYDKFKPKGLEQGNFYDIQSEILNKAYKIDQGYSLIDYTNLQKLLIELLPNYKECLLRLMKVMPVTGCLMHQLVSFFTYQLDRTTRSFMNKEKNYLEALSKLEDQNKHLKHQINATKEITQSYQKLEKDYHDLSERYQKRIEQSHEVADLLSKDIVEMQYNFRNTSLSQIDSQDELQKKLEIVIKQFTMDREQNSFKIGELKTFLDKNISMLKNNWDDKRDKECQTNFEEILSEMNGGDVPLNTNNISSSISRTMIVGGDNDNSQGQYNASTGLWDIVNQYIDQNKLKQKFNIGNELVTYKEFLQTTEDIIRYGSKYKEDQEFPKYQQIVMDYFLDQCDHTSLDYMRQATAKIAQYELILNHFTLRGGLAVCSTISKYHYNYTTQFDVQQYYNLKQNDKSVMQKIMEDYTLSLNQCIKSKKHFVELFTVGDVYENRDRQAEGYQISKDKNGYDPIQIQYLFDRVLQKDILDEKNKEQNIQNMQKLQFLQMLQNQIVLTQETPDQPLSEQPAHMKAIYLIISQIEFNNETVLDKRLWLMTLVKELIKKDKSTCFSYDNLVGNFKDGEIGKKLKSQIFQDFFDKHNPDRDFQESFYSQSDAIFQDNIVDTQFNMLSTQPVPVHTKLQTPGLIKQGSIIGKIWKKDTTKAKEALSRIVKRISIIKRLTIIRKVNEDIDKITNDHQTDNNENIVSFKKVVKILNLCHIFIPLIQVKANNSTDLSLDIKDMIEMTTSKDKYKRFVLLQSESLELLVKGFNIPVTVNNLFLLLTRYTIDKNEYFISPIEVSSILVECYNSHIQLRQIYLRNSFYDKLKSDYSGLVRPQLEQFLFDELGINNLNESHKVLYKTMMSKLKSKLDSPGVINKAIVNEQKVIYKFKDIEDQIIKKIASENIISRIYNTEVMKTVSSLAQKIREGKITNKNKSSIGKIFNNKKK